MDEDTFKNQEKRLLYVLLEPNGKGHTVNSIVGEDLQKLFKEDWKPVTFFGKNLTFWTGAIFDGITEKSESVNYSAQDQVRRVAIMNLKKRAGHGSRDTEAISVHAWRDREFIQKELQIINPDIVVTCSKAANRLFYWIVKADPFSEPPSDSIWQHDQFHVLPMNHPSAWSGQANTQDRLVQHIRDYKSLVAGLK